jgi:hypothetical protein
VDLGQDTGFSTQKRQLMKKWMPNLVLVRSADTQKANMGYGVIELEENLNSITPYAPLLKLFKNQHNAFPTARLF